MSSTRLVASEQGNAAPARQSGQLTAGGSAVLMRPSSEAHMQWQHSVRQLDSLTSDLPHCHACWLCMHPQGQGAGRRGQ